MQFIHSILSGFAASIFFSIQTISPALLLPANTYVAVSLASEQATSSSLSTLSYDIFASLFQEKHDYDSVVLVGDVLLARYVETLMSEHGTTYPYRGIDFFVLSAKPYVVGNLEAAVPAKHVATKPFTMRFSVDAANLPSLQAAGFSLVSLANNHAFDFGTAGFEATKLALQTASIGSFGQVTTVDADSVTYVQLQDLTVALIAVQAVTNTVDKAAFRQMLAESSSQSDVQIVYVHWGTEYVTKHSTSQEALATFFVDAGADLIVGHHPHVVQDIGSINGVPVFYSLGNYIFDQYFSDEVQEGLLLQLVMADGPLLNIIPITSKNTPSQPTLMTKRATSAYLTSLSQVSAPDLQSYVAAGTVPLQLPVATSSKVAIMNQ